MCHIRAIEPYNPKLPAQRMTRVLEFKIQMNIFIFCQIICPIQSILIYYLNVFLFYVIFPIIIHFNSPLAYMRNFNTRFLTINYIFISPYFHAAAADDTYNECTNY